MRSPSRDVHTRNGSAADAVEDQFIRSHLAADQDVVVGVVVVLDRSSYSILTRYSTRLEEVA